jgi:hypothetical protein
MFARLLRHRLRLWWCGMTRGAGRGTRLLGLAGLLVFSVLSFGFVAVNTGATAYALRDDNPQALPGLLALLFSVGLTFNLFTGISSIIHQLYLASDIDLLLAGPVPLRTLFRLKLSETVLSGWLPGMAVLGGLTGYGLVVGAGTAFFLLAVPVTLALLVLGAAVSMLAIMLVARVVPARRVQSVLALLGAAMGAGLWLFFQSGAAGRVAPTSEGLGVAAERWSEGADWLPTTWAGGAMFAAHQGDWSVLGLYLAALVAAALAAVRLAAEAFAYTFTVSRGRVTEAVPSSGARTEAQPRGRRAGALPLPAPVWAVAVKDLRTLRRDLRLLSGFVFPVVMAGFWGLRISDGMAGVGGTRVDGFWLGLLAVPAVLLLGLSQVGLTAVGQEGKGYAVLHLAPVEPLTLLTGKTVATAVPGVFVMGLAVLGLGLWHGAGPWMLLAGTGMVAWLAVGDAAACVAIGGIDPRFDADNPQRSSGCLSSLLSFVIGGLFLATSTALFGWLVLLGTGEIAVESSIALLVSVSLAAGVGVAIAVIAVVAGVAAQRLAAWEER